MTENRKRRDLEQQRGFSMPAYENDEWNNFAVDNWMLNDNWLLNMLSEVRIKPSILSNNQISETKRW